MLITRFLLSRNPNALVLPKSKQPFGSSSSTDAVSPDVVLPPWLSEEDIDYYVSKFEKTRYTGGINYYRALPL